MGKKKLAKTALSAALVGSMILGNAASVYAWTTSDEVSDREKASAAISLEAAGEGMVLLENNGTLPVKRRCESRCLRRRSTGNDQRRNRFR